MTNEPDATAAFTEATAATAEATVAATEAPTATSDAPTATSGAISLDQAFASFDALWSPRIATTVNDYDVRLTKVQGEHLWHVHDDTDEFFLVLGGELHIDLREPAGERRVTLPQGSLFTVPRGTEHKPSAPDGARLLLFEPSGTSTVGDRHDEVPDHVDATTGHRLAG